MRHDVPCRRMSVQQRQCSFEAHGPTEARTDFQTPGLRPIIADGHQVGRGNAGVDHPRELDSVRPGAAFAVAGFLTGTVVGAACEFPGVPIISKVDKCIYGRSRNGFPSPRLEVPRPRPCTCQCCVGNEPLGPHPCPFEKCNHPLWRCTGGKLMRAHFSTFDPAIDKIQPA